MREHHNVEWTNNKQKVEKKKTQEKEGKEKKRKEKTISILTTICVKFDLKWQRTATCEENGHELCMRFNLNCVSEQ